MFVTYRIYDVKKCDLSMPKNVGVTLAVTRIIKGQGRALRFAGYATFLKIILSKSWNTALNPVRDDILVEMW